MFDWASRNQEELKHLEPQAVAQVCFFLVTFLDRGYYISTRVRENLTPTVVKKLLDHLEREIRKKGPSSA